MRSRLGSMARENLPLESPPDERAEYRVCVVTCGPQLMIIDDLNLESIPCAPRQANSPLVVDPDGVLSSSITFQLLQLVAGYAAKLIKFSSGMDCDELLQ